MHPRLIAALAALLCIAPQALAQTAPGCTPGLLGGMNWGVSSTKDGPFTAVTKTTFEQKLGDGNAIHAESYAHQARDSSGRTMTESVMGCERGADGQMHPRLLVHVSDPAAKTSTTWQVGGIVPSSQVAQVSHVPQLLPAPQPPPPAPKLTPEEQQAAREQQVARAKEMQAQRNQTKTEQLGTKFINGVEATGTRITRTIPAGDAGNDLPLVTVQESWRSMKLGLVVMTVDDDPRRGKTTFEIQELSSIEPDPAVFVPPPDYKVQEQRPPDVRPIDVPQP